MSVSLRLARLARRLNPRRSLAVASGWLIVALTMGLSLGASQWAGRIVRATLIEQHGLRLASASDHIASQLDLAMSLRLQSIDLAASMLADDLRSRNRANLERVLGNVQHNFNDFMWIGAADPDGQVIAATKDEVIGTNVHDYAWLSRGQIVAWVEEGLDLNTPRYIATGEGQRFISVTAPIRNARGAVLGVVGARLNWRWLEDLAAEIDRDMSHVSREDWLLIDRDNIVRIGPADMVGKHWQDEAPVMREDPDPDAGLTLSQTELPERLSLHRLRGGRTILVASAQMQDLDSLQKLGWRVVVLQPVAQFNAHLLRLQWQIASVMLVLGVLAAIGGAMLVGRLTRRLRGIARSADAISTGAATRIDVPPGIDEAARLGKAIDRLLGSLAAERDELRALNAELDQRVAERTAEITRLAEDSRYSAIVRERLKIARDLHDTLAHSMMAMLTEVRLLKKLAQNRPEALTEELDRAEEAAHAGLKEARAAITQMRYNPARDIGLGAALQELCNGLAKRTGIQTRFEMTPTLAVFADSRAEPLYRIAEEALRNIERHAGAGMVDVNLQYRSEIERLELSIQDNGVGFIPEQDFPGHYGLTGLREQAEIIGADIQIESHRGKGTRITVRLPLNLAP